MKREDLKQLALDLARDLQAFCHREPDPAGTDEILRLAANASSWRDVIRHYCRERKSPSEKRSSSE